jgi:hypothetical protein
MNKECVRKLLEATAECGVPLQHAVALLFRTHRLSLGVFARQAGYQRTYLYQALAGKAPPPRAMREAMIRLLGVDPWAVYGMAPLPEEPGTPPRRSFPEDAGGRRSGRGNASSPSKRRSEPARGLP